MKFFFNIIAYLPPPPPARARFPTRGCSRLAVAVEDYPTITLKEFGSVSGEEEIMTEIMTRGPVSAYINANCIEDYTGGINMYDTCLTHTTNHAIQLNGWGTENGV